MTHEDRVREVNDLHDALASDPDVGPVLERWEYWLGRYEKTEMPHEMIEMYVLDMAAVFRYIVRMRDGDKLCFRECLRVKPK